MVEDVLAVDFRSPVHPFTRSPVRRRPRGGAPEGALFQLADFDIPEGNIVAVILEADVAFG